MRTVCPSSLFGCLVDLNVLYDEVGGIKTLGIGVGFGILEQIDEIFARLLGPASSRDTELFAFEESH